MGTSRGGVALYGMGATTDPTAYQLGVESSRRNADWRIARWSVTGASGR